MKTKREETMTGLDDEALTLVSGGADLAAERAEADQRLQLCYEWAKKGNGAGYISDSPSQRRLKCDTDYGNSFFPKKVQPVR